MARPEVSVNPARLMLLATVFLVVASLYLAREIFVPIAMAILLSFLLAPVVHRLERWRFPRAVAVLTTVLLAFGLIGGIGYVVYDQLADLGAHIGEYRTNVQSKLESFQKKPTGLVSHLEKAYHDVSTMQMTPTSKPAATSAPAGQQPAPPSDALPVVVTNQASAPGQPSERPLALVESIGGQVLGPAGKTFLVIVLTLFMLFEREELRDRVIRLVGRGQLTVTTEALDEAAERVSRYLLMQSLINGSEGVIVFVGMWVIGMINHHPFPSPALWGLLAALLRFVPYVGIWVSSLLPMSIALATFPTLAPTFEVAGTYLVMEIVTANSIEPYLLGSSTGIAPLAVLVAATFWTWLWGTVGLLLSIPLTVVLVVLGRYVPQFEFLSILLGEEPALNPSARVYQRLLAMDLEEAEALVHKFALAQPIQQLYAELLMPALLMMRWDYRRGNLDEERHDFLRSGLAHIVDLVGEQHKAQGLAADANRMVEAARGHEAAPAGAKTLSTTEVPTAPVPFKAVNLPAGCEINVLCMPAHDVDDEIGASMLAQLLEVQGYCVLKSSAEQLASEAQTVVESFKPSVVFLSALPPAAALHARYLCKRLRARWPDLDIVVGLWAPRHAEHPPLLHMEGDGHLRTVTNLADALDIIHQRVQPLLIAPDTRAAAEAPLK